MKQEGKQMFMGLSKKKEFFCRGSQRNANSRKAYRKREAVRRRRRRKCFCALKKSEDRQNVEDKMKKKQRRSKKYKYCPRNEFFACSSPPTLPGSGAIFVQGIEVVVRQQLASVDAGLDRAEAAQDANLSKCHTFNFLLQIFAFCFNEFYCPSQTNYPFQ